ncbi:MAG: hypothetical protein ABFD53_00180 [Anaerolineaceae bacterium]
MQYNKKIPIFAFCVSITFLLSAFSYQLDKSHSSNSRIYLNQAAENITPTATQNIDAIQPTSIIKNQKTPQPTKTPKPTFTPPTIPPPADPGAGNAMIGLAILTVSVILFGFWLNRRRIF